MMRLSLHTALAAALLGGPAAAEPFTLPVYEALKDCPDRRPR